MGPCRNDKGTYSKHRQAATVTEDGRRNRYKQRKTVPQFSNLFLPKDENQKTQDYLDSLLGETTKPTDASEDIKSKAFRKPLAVNSILTNSTFGSLGHSSANDTFDRLVQGGNKLGIRSSRNTNGVLFSSSGSSFDATGVLYQSLRCEAQANSLCSAGDRWKSQVIKKEIDNSRNAYDSHARIPEEHDCSNDKIPVGKDESQLSDAHVVPVSPQLFSSYDDKQKKTKLRGKKKIKSNRASKGKKAVESSIKHKSGKSGEQSHCIDDLRDKETYDGNFNCDKEGSSKDFRSPLNPFKKPFIKFECSATASCSPQLENGLLSPNNGCGFTGTPSSIKFAKAFMQQKYLLSQNGLSEASQTSRGSQGSGKSSAKSDVLTSTPADVSRSKSLVNSISPWNIKTGAMLEHPISPVPREKSSVTATLSDFQSPMSFKVKSISPSYQKSRTSPSHGSHYQTCFSDKCGTSDGKQGCCTRSNEGADNVVQHGYYNSSLELRSGPFKGIIIPLYDPTGGMQKESSLNQSLESSPGEYLQQRAQSVAQSSPESPITLRNRTTKASQERFTDQVIPMSGGVVLQEISKNLSSEKLKQINSFLNRQSFTLPRKTRHQKTQFRKKRAEPSSGVRRLTRRTARMSKFQKSRDVGNTDTSGSIYQKENVNTDESTTTEPSIILPRKKPCFALKSNALRLLHVKRETVNSSSDSVSTNCSVVSKNNYAAYASDAHFAKPSPVLTRRTSVRLAGKRKNADRSSSSYSNKSFVSKLGRNMAYISTRSATKRLQNTGKQLSIMQFSLSSAQSVQTDLEESGYSVASNNAVSDKGSVVCTKIKREKKSFHNDSDECDEKSSQPYDAQVESSAVQSYSLEREPLENQIIKEECEDSDIALDDDKIPRDERIPRGDHSQATYPSTSSFKTTQVSFKEDHDDFSSADLSVGEVFELPFQKAVQAKRGKGWLRSLSVARASLIGEEQIQENIRRQTVHRMSVSVRRMTHLHMLALPEMTEKIIQEMGESYSEAEDYLSRSILCDPKRHVLMLCSQVEPIPITDCFTESRLSCCKKIGEGVYGEVFMTMPNPNSMDGATVLKIMPIEGDFDVNGEPQKKFEEILSEIIISLELSNLRKTKEGSNWTESFVHVLNCWCVEGSYAHDMLQLWDLYHEEKGSENDRPDIFPESQLYIVLEFTHGGRDLEGFVFNNASQSLGIFLQIAYSLAVAEQELEFEHRDLHWGNVLVASTKENSVDFKISDGTYTLQTQGVKATVIDFTLSRLKAPHCVMYNNLAQDPSLFTAQGDYQFEIYRQMKKANRNEWQSFTPYTNVLWLHYILDKMINECYYKNVKTKVHKTNMDQLHKLKQTMLDSESATAFVLRRELDLT